MTGCNQAINNHIPNNMNLNRSGISQQDYAVSILASETATEEEREVALGIISSSHSLKQQEDETFLLSQSEYNNAMQEVEQLENDIRHKFDINRCLDVKNDGNNGNKYSSHGSLATTTLSDSERMNLGISLSKSKMRRPPVQDEKLKERQTYSQMLNMGRLRAEQNKRQIGKKPDEKNFRRESEGQALETLQNTMISFQKENDREDQNNKNDKKKKSRKKYFIFGAVIIVLMTIITVVIIFITKDKDKRAAIVQIEATSFNVEECYLDQMYETERYQMFRSILAMEGIHLSESTNDSESISQAALCWISNFDPLQMNNTAENAYEIVERYVMVLIYFYFVGFQERQNYILAGLNWMSEVSVCEWERVKCEIDAEIGYISKLLFSNLYLEGRIPTELALLKRLTHLELQDNNLEGNIPSQIWGMTQLKTLDMGYNELEGSLSSNISNLHRLQYLDLTRNNILGKIPNFSQLTSLKTLILNDVPQLRGSISDLLGSSKLENLILGSNAISGSISSKLWTLTNLKILEIRNTKVTGTIPSELENLKNLEKLKLSSGLFHGTLPTELGNLPKLKELDLQSLLRLSGTVPSELGRLESLEKMKLLRTPINGSFPKEICSITSLIDISASCNILECECCQCFYA